MQIQKNNICISTVGAVQALCTGTKGTADVYSSDTLIIVYKVPYSIMKSTL